MSSQNVSFFIYEAKYSGKNCSTVLYYVILPLSCNKRITLKYDVSLEEVLRKGCTYSRTIVLSYPVTELWGIKLQKDKKVSSKLKGTDYTQPGEVTKLKMFQY